MRRSSLRRLVACAVFGAAAGIGAALLVWPGTAAAGVRGPVGIARGPDKALWFTIPSDNAIGRMTRDGTVRIFTGSGIRRPWLITAGRRDAW